MFQRLKEQTVMKLNAIKQEVLGEDALLIGADPEFFLFDKKTEKMISADGLVPGTKEEPYKVPNGAIQLDGTAVEFNIDPAKTPEEFQKNVESVLKTLRKHLPKRYTFTFTPSVVYDRKYFDTFIPDKPKELGCSPDYDAYSKLSKVPPNLPSDKRFLRTGSGHLHIGWTKDANPLTPEHLNDCYLLVRVLEYFIGPYAFFYDFDSERSQLYGAPGSFRPKPYGLEWRAPSNEWLNHPALMKWYYEAIQAVYKSLKYWNNAKFKDLVQHSATYRPTSNVPNRINATVYALSDRASKIAIHRDNKMGWEDLFGYIKSELYPNSRHSDEKVIKDAALFDSFVRLAVPTMPSFPMQEILPKVKERYVELTGNKL